MWSDILGNIKISQTFYRSPWLSRLKNMLYSDIHIFLQKIPNLTLLIWYKNTRLWFLWGIYKNNPYLKCDFSLLPLYNGTFCETFESFTRPPALHQSTLLYERIQNISKTFQLKSRKNSSKQIQNFMKSTKLIISSNKIDTFLNFHPRIV